jgi:uncharacterized protein YbjT (DUF2867 family)
MRRACAGVDRAFLLTNSTERAEQHQSAFTRVAHQSGERHIVNLSQLHAAVSAPGRFLRYHDVEVFALKGSDWGHICDYRARPNLFPESYSLLFRRLCMVG